MFDTHVLVYDTYILTVQRYAICHKQVHNTCILMCNIALKFHTRNLVFYTYIIIINLQWRWLFPRLPGFWEKVRPFILRLRFFFYLSGD